MRPANVVNVAVPDHVTQRFRPAEAVRRAVGDPQAVDDHVVDARMVHDVPSHRQFNALARFPRIFGPVKKNPMRRGVVEIIARGF